MLALPLEGPVKNQRCRSCERSPGSDKQSLSCAPWRDVDHVATEYGIGGLNWPNGVACIQQNCGSYTQAFGPASMGVDIRKRIYVCVAWLPIQSRGKPWNHIGRVLTRTAGQFKHESRAGEHARQHRQYCFSIAHGRWRMVGKSIVTGGQERTPVEEGGRTKTLGVRFWRFVDIQHR